VKLARRKILHVAVAAAVLSAATPIASALDYPVRAVHIIVGFRIAPTSMRARSLANFRSMPP
jgi:hypothetical protein